MSESTPATPELGIRERLAALPKPGEIVWVTIAGFGTVPVKVLSRAQVISLRTNGAVTAAAVLDEKGQPLFASPADLDALGMAGSEVFMRAYAKVNELAPEQALKN